ncbi:50S ribosomal protein L18 [Kiritimatiella glycovorans]|uniref:Large ribosomal subunit protein uL18 n=1 Tax=Kiritimatiella glycovorans TaxID=1307763 RepID=A0A0G3EEP0_9BACT|nr:50S ribosomal protein L18 [Kiritimatiella glycovorans]AKJ64941.1 50S ribosomal protein L18 [Kiritimatiella glycovorans]
MKIKTRKDYRKRRHLRLRRKVHGTAERPRMSVFISNRAIYVQLIDDERAATLFAADSSGNGGKDADTARKIGKSCAEAALEQGIKGAVFDRGGFRFGKRMAAIADGAREAGLNI